MWYVIVYATSDGSDHELYGPFPTSAHGEEWAERYEADLGEDAEVDYDVLHVQPPLSL